MNIEIDIELAEQIRLHKEISKKIEELEEQKKALGQSILQGMTGKTLQMGDFFVRRCSRFSITTTVDEARTFQAVKLEEVVDKDKIKALHKNGQTIPGIKEIEYIQINIPSEKKDRLS